MNTELETLQAENEKLRSDVAEAEADVERYRDRLREQQHDHEEELRELAAEAEVDNEALRAIAERAWLYDARRTENDLLKADLAEWIPEIRTDYEAGRLGKKASAA